MTNWVTQPTTPVQVLVPSWLLSTDQSLAGNEPSLKTQIEAKACPTSCDSLKQVTKTVLSGTERHWALSFLPVILTLCPEDECEQFFAIVRFPTQRRTRFGKLRDGERFFTPDAIVGTEEFGTLIKEVIRNLITQWSRIEEWGWARRNWDDDGLLGRCGWDCHNGWDGGKTQTTYAVWSFLTSWSTKLFGSAWPSMATYIERDLSTTLHMVRDFEWNKIVQYCQKKNI